MTFTILNVINSIANQISSLCPEYPIYISPTYNTDFPCFYIFLMTNSIENEPGGRHVRELPFDIVFVQERNASNQNEGLLNVLEALDGGMDMLTYTDGTDSCLLHCNDRSGHIEDQELHYNLTIKQRVSVSEITEYMQSLEAINVKIKTAEVSSGETAEEQGIG
jgi:hypothetical protein